jgi:hypothetical protein
VAAGVTATAGGDDGEAAPDAGGERLGEDGSCVAAAAVDVAGADASRGVAARDAEGAGVVAPQPLPATARTTASVVTFHVDSTIARLAADVADGTIVPAGARARTSTVSC